MVHPTAEELHVHERERRFHAKARAFCPPEHDLWDERDEDGRGPNYL